MMGCRGKATKFRNECQLTKAWQVYNQINHLLVEGLTPYCFDNARFQGRGVLVLTCSCRVPSLSRPRARAGQELRNKRTLRSIRHKASPPFPTPLHLQYRVLPTFSNTTHTGSCLFACCLLLRLHISLQTATCVSNLRQRSLCRNRALPTCDHQPLDSPPDSSHEPSTFRPFLEPSNPAETSQTQHS